MDVGEKRSQPIVSMRSKEFRTNAINSCCFPCFVEERPVSMSSLVYGEESRDVEGDDELVLESSLWTSRRAFLVEATLELSSLEATA